MPPPSPTAATLSAVFSTVRLPTPLEEFTGQQSVCLCMSFSVNNRKTIIVMTSGGRVQPQGTVARSPSIEETTERFAHGVVLLFASLERARHVLAGRRHDAPSHF